MKYSVRDLSIIGIFSALNGVCEIGIGTVLHIMKVPFTGSLMLFFNLVVYLTLKKLIPRPGTVIITGFLTAMLTLLYAGGNKLSPSIAIFAEALIIELILDFIPLNKLSAALTGALTQPFTLFYPFFSYILLGGSAGLIEKLVAMQWNIFHGLRGPLLVLCLVSFYILIGALEGLAAWKVSAWCLNSVCRTTEKAAA
jgi:hypothetical protein